MTSSLFTRSPLNPILTPGERWWEARAVFNPGAALFQDRVALVYRAVGADGISRLGLAWTRDGESIEERSQLPWYEASPDDAAARLGVEDPRLIPLDGSYYLTYCKVAVSAATTPPLSWETAPFQLRTGIARTEGFQTAREIGIMAPGTNTKDAVLFPARIEGRYAALIREYPSIQYQTSADLRQWSEPVEVLAPIPGGWEAERVGAGPPPLLTPWGWLLLYHGNAYLQLPANRRLYAMGLAILETADPGRVRYRHPEPVFWPDAPYEREGPVGNVVFGTGLVRIGGRFYLYYGAGDGVIGVAWVEHDALYAFLRRLLGPA